MEALESLPMAPCCAKAAAILRLTGPDDREERLRFDAATTAALSTRVDVVAEASLDRWDELAFFS